MPETPWHRELRRFSIEWLCLLLLLYGSPLQALEQAKPASAEPELATAPPAAHQPVPEAGEPGFLNSALVSAQRAGATVASQPWGDAFAILAGAAALAVPQGGPPSPPNLSTGKRPETPPELPAELAARSALEAVPLFPGPNLVSLPEQPVDTSPATVLAPITGSYSKVFAHDACDSQDPWKIYDPADPAGSDLTVIDPSVAFWIDATGPVALPSEGTLPASTTLQLCTGWNLVPMPIGEPRHPRTVLSPIEGKWVRIFGYELADSADPWELFDVAVPAWANDLELMQPGRGYWVLVNEDVTLEIGNEGPPPTVALTAPQDLAVVTAPTEVHGTVQSPLLERWTLAVRAADGGGWAEIAAGNAPVDDGKLGDLDPTLLKNGLYELRLQAFDVAGQLVEETIAVALEGQMKIGLFTLSFVDLAVPLSGLSIEVIRTYDSRDKTQGDFGVGWTLDVRQGSYRNNRPPGDGWRILEGFLPCDSVQETKSHLTTVRLSDQEVYRFRLLLENGAATGGGCFAEAGFAYVDGPLPGTTLEILGNRTVFFANGSNRVVDSDTQEDFVPRDVRLTTRDGRTFDLDLAAGVTRLEDLNGNELQITAEGITHSSGVGIAFERDTEGRITKITDPRGKSLTYEIDPQGDLAAVTDRGNRTTRFTYGERHLLLDIQDPRGIKPIRNNYDDAGRLIRHTDAFGKKIELAHDIAGRREIVTDRLGHSRILEYNERGNVVRESGDAVADVARTFDARDNLLTETDALNRTTTFTYTAANDLVSIKDPLGNLTTYTYNDRGQLLTVKNALENETTSVYDTRGNLLETTDALNGKTTFTYDAAGNLLTVTDSENQVTSFEYDGRGNQTKQIDALGNETVSTYDDDGNQLTETRSRTLADGTVETLSSTFVYDGLDRVIETRAPDGRTTRIAYDLLGKVVSRTDALERVTRMTYDSMGQLIATDYPDGTRETLSYDAEGRLISQVDRAQRKTTSLLDPVGRLLTTTYADGAKVSNVYDGAGQLTATTDARNNTTSYEVDAAGRRTAVIDPTGNGPTFTHDKNGNQKSVTDARLKTTTFTYDALNRLTKTTFPDATSTQVGYDALGRRVSETDQANVTTRFEYDALSRLTKVIDALDQETRYTYDELGDRLTQTDANNHTTRFEYDQGGRQTKRILPGGADETKSYNLDGTLASHTDFNGATRAFEYDSSQRLTRRAYPDGSQVTFAYTPIGQRESVTDARGTTVYSYDLRDRLLEKVDPNGYKLSYAYDLHGNRTSLKATVGTQVYTTSYTHDALNRLETVTDFQGQVYNLAYNENGSRSSLAFPNGATTSYTYDDLNRLADLSTVNSAGEVLQSYAYTLGLAGNRTRIDEHDGTSRHYAYDDLHRLTQDRVIDASATQIYQRNFIYDPVGNRQEQVVHEGGGQISIASTYDDRDRLLTADTTSYGWDTNGNLISQDGSSYGWDLENRLRSVTLADGTLAETSYDADGNRISTAVMPPGGPTTAVDYLVDTTGFLSHVVADVVDGSVQTLYTRADDQLVGLHRPVSGTSRYYHADGLGSVRVLSDDAGAVTDRYSFTAFGKLFEHSGSDVQPYRFAGEPFDPSIGFYYNRARWLDVASGRFASVDIFAGFQVAPATLHQYLYASSNPTENIDPTGLFTVVEVSIVNAVKSIVTSIQIDTGTTVLTQPSVDPNGEITKALIILSLATAGPGIVRGIFSLARAAKRVFGSLSTFLRNGGIRRAFEPISNILRRGSVTLPAGMRRLALSNVTGRGMTQLGHFPGYIQKAKATGRSYFDIGSAWKSLNNEQRKAMNRHFLDTISGFRDQVFVGVPRKHIGPGSWLEWEISYLVNKKGYKWINQHSLVKR